MTLIAGTTIILGAIYMLNVFRKSFFGQVTNSKIIGLKDLTRREVAALVPLTLLVIILGVYPKPILEPAESSAKKLVELMFKKSQSFEAKLSILDYNSIAGGAK
jgi:NADH-quinone oxidoreductase subunit M